jgi:4-diphosphocytidyl-2-C-methyl-D-erythritol kinase
MGITLFSPAKINLFLAITDRRADGFHNLVSVAAPLAFGDELEARRTEMGDRRSEMRGAGSSEGGQFSLVCDDPAVPGDDRNLVLKAARAFAAATGFTGCVEFKLTKRIPMGAGLGGGSSNAVAALRALQELAGHPLSAGQLAEVAATLGSDCALFLHDAPVVMRGRGERVAALPADAAARLRGQRVLVFKPGFGISTPWAYQRMVARGADYWPAAQAEAQLAAWIAGDGPATELFFNNMEPAAFEKYIALPVMLEKLRRELGVTARMSGSGSACFAWLPEDVAPEPVLAVIREGWGPAVFAEVTRLA